MKKTVIVTGASSGIGRAISQELVELDYEVIGLCRRVDEVCSGVQAIRCDLSDETQIADAFAQVGGIDAIVNNAGVALMSKISEGDLEAWDRMWDINVRALSLCSYLALGKFKNQQGQVINVSSMSGHRVPPGGGFYAPTKFAVRAITESLRLELRAQGSAVRVSSISPGFVETPLLDDYFAGREELLEKTKQEIKMLHPKDVAEKVVHIIQTPQHVEIGDVQMRSVDQGI